MKESGSQQSLSQEAVSNGGRYVRQISPYLLYEYSDQHDAVYGPDILETLGVQDSSDQEKLEGLVGASTEELGNVFEGSTTKVVPHTIIQEDIAGKLEIASSEVVPDVADDSTRLGYLGTVLDYFETRIGDFNNLLDGKSEQSPLFHTDLAKPLQYVYGRIDQTSDPCLYFVDVGPEITVLATNDDYGWVLSAAFRHSLLEMAATIGHNESVQGAKAYMERFSEFTARLLQEGFIDKNTISRISLLLNGEEGLGYDTPDYRLPDQQQQNQKLDLVA